MRDLVDLRQPQRVHIVGAGGPGMSAIALVLAQMGHEVSVSDVRDGPNLARLRSAGIAVTIGHDASLIEGCTVVSASPAVPHDNAEVAAARAQGDVFVSRAGILAAICSIAPTIAVAGTHGKTTTTSLLIHIFDHAGLDPNFVVGGDIKELRTNARWSGSEWTIVEADESDGTHLELPVTGTILTNVDVDHLDHYGDFEGIVDSFSRYLAGIHGPKVVCADDVTARGLMSSSKRIDSCVTYGSDRNADFTYSDVSAVGGTTFFRVAHGDTSVDVTTSLRGEHNVSNITGALAMAVQCGIDLSRAAKAVSSFDGVGRRFDIRGHVDGFTLVDDYAHLPREIDAVLTAARTSGDGWRRVIAVFQPNRFNRMSEISAEYAGAFRSADVIVITDIYSSGTAKIDGVTGHLVVDAILTQHHEAEVVWVQERTELAARVSDLLESGDVCVSMGCGDIEHLPDEIIALRRAARHE